MKVAHHISDEINFGRGSHIESAATPVVQSVWWQGKLFPRQKVFGSKVKGGRGGGGGGGRSKKVSFSFQL